MKYDFGRAFPPVPDSYHQALEHALNHLEDMHMKRRHKFQLALAAAILAALILAGGALAATNAWGIMDYLRGKGETLQPIEGAEKLITGDIGSVQTALARMTVREAVFDGKNVRAIITLEPLDPGKYALRSDIEGYENEEAPANLETISFTEPEVTIGNAKAMLGSGTGDIKDGIVTSYAELGFDGEVPDTLSVKVSAQLQNETIEIPFELARACTPLVGQFTPLDAGGRDFSIQSTRLIYTPLAGYLEVVYTSESPDGALWGQHFKENTTYYTTPRGKFAHVLADCSGMEGAEAITAQQAAERQLLPCPTCMDSELQDLSKMDRMRWEFCLADGADEMRWLSGGPKTAEDGTREYVSVCLVPTSDALPEHISIQPIAMWTGEASGEPIECTLIK